jgi:hypothetical protein
VGEFDQELKYVADCDYWMRAMQGHHLARIPEFLAIDTIQPGALRSAVTAGVRAETALVRQRYVDLNSRAHLMRHLCNQAWSAAWRRVYWAELLYQYGRARRLGPRRWQRWLQGSAPKLSLVDALMAQVPGVGQSYAWRALRSGGTADG